VVRLTKFGQNVPGLLAQEYKLITTFISNSPTQEQQHTVRTPRQSLIAADK